MIRVGGFLLGPENLLAVLYWLCFFVFVFFVFGVFFVFCFRFVVVVVVTLHCLTAGVKSWWIVVKTREFTGCAFLFVFCYTLSSNCW